MAIVTEDRTPAMEAQFPASPEATELLDGHAVICQFIHMTQGADLPDEVRDARDMLRQWLSDVANVSEIEFARLSFATPEATEGQGELKPCPFCGGEAERLELTDDGNFGGSVICCKKCGASSPVHFDRKENLDSSWNDRSRSAHADIETGEPGLLDYETDDSGVLQPHDAWGGPNDAARLEAGAPAGDAVSEEVKWLKRIGDTASELCRMGKDYSLYRLKTFIPSDAHFVLDNLAAHPSPPIDGLVERLTAELAEALERVDELERYADNVSAEFERDCMAAMGRLLSELHYEAEVDGWTAADAEEYISITIGEIEAAEKRNLARAETAEARLAASERALAEIARQKLGHELTDDAHDRADFRGAYDTIVSLARAALSQAQPTAPGAKS